MNNAVQGKCSQKIVADIGGTNARFALLNSDGSMQQQIALKGEEHSGFIEAFKKYLDIVGAPRISEAAIAIANPIEGDLIKMTNHNWNFSIEESRVALGLDTLIFKNDFEALAMSLPFLKPEDSHQIGGGVIQKERAIGVLGPGTGLGVSGLVPSGEKWVPFSSEGGHVSLSPTSEREIQIFQLCLKEYEHVSAERLISGKGLQFIYSSICRLDGVDPKQDLSPLDISTLAIAQTDSQCEEALDVFSGLLGGAAGNLALTLGAKGGIYIGGGIVPKLGSYFENSPFRERFEAKGRFRKYLKEIPVFVIKSEYSALIGVREYLDC